MLIRTQDKLGLVNANGRTISAGFDNKSKTHVIYVDRSDTKLTVFGDYSSKEKLIKVLDMIEEAYARWQGADGNGKYYTSTFQMPQDGDV